MSEREELARIEGLAAGFKEGHLAGYNLAQQECETERHDIDARAKAWQEGWDARAKYLGTDGDHWPGRNPYAEGRADAE